MEIMPIIKQVFTNAAQKVGYKSMFGVFLYGSQNYNLDTEKSDIDLTLVWIPDIEDILIKNNNLSIPEPVKSFTVNGIDITTHWTSLPDFIHNICYKPSLSSIEYLCSPYQDINPYYATAWENYFVKRADKILRGNFFVLTCNLGGQALNYLKKGIKEYNKKYLTRYYFLYTVIYRLFHETIISAALLQMDDSFLKRIDEDIEYETERTNLMYLVSFMGQNWAPSQTENIKNGLYLLMRMKENAPYNT